MTEYWVSQPKHYCKFCKCWLANNKVSIQHHESGQKHKGQVEQFFKEKREAKFQGARSQSEVDKELREIERLAREQAEEDAALFGGALPKAPPPPPPRPLGQAKPPPPPPRRHDPSIGYKREDEGEEGKDGAEEVPEEEKGKYTVGDVTYLEGKHHEKRLVTGVSCEVWLEAEDRWIPEATVVSVRETAVPNTDLVLRKYEVSYKLQPEDPEATVEAGVTSDRLRLVDRPQEVAAPVISESTGVGMWQTVAVRVVNEEEERRAALEAALLDQMTRKEKEAKERLRQMEEAMEGEDAMSSYDPYGKGMYKGVDLKATVEIEAEVDLGGDANGPVAFKKRKLGDGKGKFRRRTRDADDK